MTLTKLILIIIGLIALYISQGQKGTVQKVITAGIFFAILLKSSHGSGMMLSILLLLITALQTIAYAIVEKGLKQYEKLIIAAIGIVYLAAFMLRMQHYPGQLFFNVLLCLVVTLYIVIAIGSKTMVKERGFMLLWSALSILQLVTYFNLHK